MAAAVVVLLFRGDVEKGSGFPFRNSFKAEAKKLISIDADH